MPILSIHLAAPLQSSLSLLYDGICLFPASLLTVNFEAKAIVVSENTRFVVILARFICGVLCIRRP